MNSTRPRVRIDWLTQPDRFGVLAIEQQAFQDALDEEGLRAYLSTGHHVGRVLCLGEEVLGYMLYELRRRSLHLHRLAVAAPVRRQGVARALLLDLQAKLRHQRRALTTSVEEGRLPFCLCLKALGFRCVSSTPDPEAPGARRLHFHFLALEDCR